MQSVFWEHHNYHVKTNYTTRLTMLIVTNLLATLQTNPIDVCLSKILTQSQKDEQGLVKYRGLYRTLKTVYKEEGHAKFLSGLHPRFMFNLMNGLMYLFIYDRFSEYVNEIYK